MMTATRRELTDRATTEGFVTIPVKLQGAELDSIAITIDADLDEEDGPGYLIQSDEDSRWASDEEDTRSAVAELAREIRNAEIDRRAEADNESARDSVDRLCDAGRAADVLRALKAANLI
jgi:hypothetical protein